MLPSVGLSSQPAVCGDPEPDVGAVEAPVRATTAHHLADEPLVGTGFRSHHSDSRACCARTASWTEPSRQVQEQRSLA
jgi:hypothetical protein